MLGKATTVDSNLVRVVLACILVIIGLGFVACSLYRTTLQSDADRDAAFLLQQKAEARLERANNALFYGRLKSAFTKEQLTAMIARHVTYTLSINKKPLSSGTPIVYSDTPDIVITFGENYDRSAQRLFPEKLLEEMSSIREAGLAEILQITTNEATFETTSRTTGDGIRTDIRLTGVKPGEIITLDMDPSFAESLGLTDSIVEIFYNVSR
ncbi:MAG: hypothetical protein ACYCYM_10765 [Saccharofermentanales bacterium]